MLNKSCAFNASQKLEKTNEITVDYFSSWSSGNSYGFGYDYRPMGSEPLMGSLYPPTFDKYELTELYSENGYGSWEVQASFRSSTIQEGLPQIVVTRLDTGKSCIIYKELGSQSIVSDSVAVENGDYSGAFLNSDDVGKVIPLNIKVIGGG